MSRLPHILDSTGNSCRSHMAEGILQNALGASARVSSAGSDPSGYVHSMAIEVMREIGIDISSHTSEHMDTYLNQEVSVVITVCDHADQACPTFPETRPDTIGLFRIQPRPKDRMKKSS